MVPISPRLNKKSKIFNWAGGVNKGQKESKTSDRIILEGKNAELLMALPLILGDWRINRYKSAPKGI